MKHNIVFTLFTLTIYGATGIDAAERSFRPETAAKEFASTDWPWWRGPNRDGIASPDQDPPLKWSDTDNVLWKSPVPGRGYGSPILFGNKIFLATADVERETQSVLCFDRETGKELWQTDVHKGGFTKKGNTKSTLANGTPACDGERLFVNFLNSDAIFTTALDLNGNKIWQKRITDFAVHQGFSSSPALYDSLVIVTADSRENGAVAALDRKSGEVVWQNSRPKLPNYTSPIIFNVAGKDQVFLQGCDVVTSLDPLTGKTNWEMKGSTEECVTSTVTDGKHIFTTGGYPRNHIAAINVDGSKKVEWENGVRVYVPSMLLRDGYLYATLDAGVAMCWNSHTGKELWKGRLGGTISSSPVMVGEHILVTNEEGTTYIFKTSPNEFIQVGENQLGTEAFATPTICGSRIYHRVAVQQNDKRQEFLYCLGKSSQK
ncbi:MAG: serine/threonine protein kinase [Planctomycetes bacterium]|nr:serine/threonine protein kinase [Planctomycetota bacterium]